jgi:hypothetical protein
MRRLWAGVLVLSLGGLALAWDDPKTEGKKDPPGRAERLKEVEKAQADFMKDFMPKYREANDKKEKETVSELMKGYQASRKKAAEAAWAIAEENPKDDAGLAAMIYAMGMGASADQQKQARTWIAEHHVANPKVKDALSLMGRGPEGKAFLLNVLEKNTDKNVRGMICYQLGSTALSAAEKEKDKEKLAELEKEAFGYLDRVVKEFPDAILYGTAKVGPMAEGAVYAYKNLRVGLTVPEVEGEDVDGAKFKLSDYRGKVVMVDFWGHW